MLKLFLAIGTAGVFVPVIVWTGSHHCVSPVNSCHDSRPVSVLVSKDVSLSSIDSSRLTKKGASLDEENNKSFSTSSSTVKSSVQPTSTSFQISSKGKSTRKSFCPSSTKTLIMGETNSFLVFICGKNHPSQYVGVAKSGGASILLTLSDVKPDSFTARNNTVSYIFTPSSLTITEDGQLLREEPVTFYKSD
jgi:hypothetical protein